MDLAALLLILLKYYGLYWLFDYDVNYEYPIRQFEMTLGIAIAQSLLYLGVASVDKSVFDVFFTYIGLYVAAAAMELGLKAYYSNVITKIDLNRYIYRKWYGVGKTPTLPRSDMIRFNIIYTGVIVSLFLITK